MDKIITKFEVLTLLLSLQALLETNNTEKALELITRVVAQIEKA